MPPVRFKERPFQCMGQGDYVERSHVPVLARLDGNEWGRGIWAYEILTHLARPGTVHFDQSTQALRQDGVRHRGVRQTRASNWARDHWIHSGIEEG
jgi:hypothetical protein